MTEDLTTGPGAPDPTDAGLGVGSLKEPAPGLSMRAPRPAAVRLRKSVVRVIVIGGVVLISGSLAWAFVLQPELRDGARARAAEAREDEARGVVRPAEVVTDQPASYDRLPEPRGHEGEDAVDPVAEPVASPRPGSPPAYRSSQAAAPRGPTPRELAARSGLFFAESAGAPAAGTTSS